MKEIDDNTTPLRVVVFFSGSASSMRYLLEHDENYGKAYTFVGALTENPDASGITAAEGEDIPVVVHNFKEWKEKNNVEAGNIDAREGYFAEVVEKIKEWNADVLMFSGFMLITTNPLISEYEGRILNVHPADLRVTDEEGKRKYIGVGSKVVRQAMEAGDEATYSTVHIVTRGVDEGPIVAISDPLPVREGVSPDEQQEEMKFACDGPAFKRAFERIASGEFELPLR